MSRTLLHLSLVGLLALAGCSTRIEERPIEIVELSAASSIEQAGGDPDDWRIEGSCVAQGHCRVDIYRRDGNRLVTSNSYVVKDSRATVNGNDNISSDISAISDS